MEAESFVVFVFMSLIAFYTGRISLRKKNKFLNRKLTDKHLENQVLLLKIAEIEAKYEGQAG